MFLCLAALLVCLSLDGNAKPNRGSVKLVTYNIKASSGLDDVRDYRRAAYLIKQVDADVYALQEVDSMTRRSGGVDGVQVIAERLEMHGEFAKAIDFEGGGYGVGLLSKRKPLRTEHVPLRGREELRVALIAEFDKYVVIATHLSLNVQDQLSSIETLGRKVREYGSFKPVFVLGDLNFTPDSQVFKEMSAMFALLSDCATPTFPSDKPIECLDYIWVSNLTKSNYEIEQLDFFGDMSVSDHRPVGIAVEFSTKVPRKARSGKTS